MKKRKDFNLIKYDESDRYHYKHHIERMQKRYNELKGIISQLRFEKDPRDEKYIDEYKKEIADIEEWAKDEGLVKVLHRDREKGVGEYYPNGGGKEKVDWERYTFEEPTLNEKENNKDDFGNEQLTEQVFEGKITNDEAFDLLKKLEKRNYKKKKADNLIIDNKSFSHWSSEYIKKNFLQESFNEAFEELKLNGILEYSKFVFLTNPPSKWYEKKFINIFIYHCNHPKGRYFNQKNNKKFEADKKMNIDGDRKKCFLLISA